ncbi:MAG: 6,7-dimethyl-8-ribityllumazine synthase [Verrucomicrobiota bacterium]
MKSSGVTHTEFTGSGRVGIVASLFNKEYVDGLIESAQNQLAGIDTLIERVPGSYEIPLAVKLMFQKEQPDLVIAFGLIWEGQTAHADLLAVSVTDALLQLSLDFEKPVLHQVLTVKDEEQARERCFGDNFNRGTEAGQAALFFLQKHKD